MTPRSPSASQQPRRLSREGLELIKTFEGFRPRSARLPGGRFVIGYGHVSSTREGVRITEADAHALLIYDLLQIEASVNEWALAPLTQNQFDALVSFALSVGLKAFRRSNVLRHVNQGSMLQAAGAIEMWRQADLDGEAVVVDALVRRRAAEKALFLTPPEGHVPASSAVLRPLLDYSAHASIPRRPPEDVTVPLDGDVATFTRETDRSDPFAPLAAAAAAAAVYGDAPDLTDDEQDLASPFELEPTADLGPETGPDAEPDPAVNLESSVELIVIEYEESAEPLPAEPEFETTLLLVDEAPPEGQEPTSLSEPRSEPEPEPEDEDENDEWSAARAAAAAVTARLQELLPREEFVDPSEDEAEVLPLHPSPPEDDLEDEPAPGGDTLPEIEPFPLEALEPRPSPGSNVEPLQPFLTPLTESPADAADSDEAAQPVDLGAYEPLPTPPESVPTGPYLLMGLVGLLFIIASLVSLFRSPAPGEAVEGVSALVLALGLIGIGLISAALWMTLGREESDSNAQDPA